MPTSADPRIKSGAANLRRGIEFVGGDLHLTESALQFEPHGFNVQGQPELIPLEEVAAVRPAWVPADWLPLRKSAIAVQLHSGEERRFVVSDRSEWQAAIQEARS